MENHLVIATFVPQESSLIESERIRFWRNANDKRNFVIKGKLQDKFFERYGTQIVGHLINVTLNEVVIVSEGGGCRFAHQDKYQELDYDLHHLNLSRKSIDQVLEIIREEDKEHYWNHRNGIKELELQCSLGEDKINEFIPGYWIRHVAQLYPKDRFGVENTPWLKYDSETVVVQVKTKDELQYEGFTNLRHIPVTGFLPILTEKIHKDYENLFERTEDVIQIPSKSIKQIVVLATKDQLE